MDSQDISIGNDVTMRESASDALAVIDQFEIVRKLGGGGFGSVYLARDTVAGIEVAVKGLPPVVRNNTEELERIRANFALVSRLHHPYIAAALHLHRVQLADYRVNGVYEELNVGPGDTLMVMEYAPGVTLSQWRKQFPGGKVPLDVAANLVYQVAMALDYSHAHQVLHRDVKPSNIMVETQNDGSVVARVLDFGLAAEIKSSMGRVSTEIHDTSGTRPYMAPEQWAGRKQGPATDQYALAVVICELVTGEVPFASVFECGDPVVMMTAVCNRETMLPNDCPFRGVLLKALAKQPDTRFDSCSDFVAHLTRDFEGCVEPIQFPLQSIVGQKWLWVFTFLLVGIVASVIVYINSPLVYVATSELVIDARRGVGDSRGASSESVSNSSSIYEEIFNSHISDWRSDEVVVKIVQQYRAHHPESTVTDEEIISILAVSELNLLHNSRIVTIVLKSQSPTLCAALADAYAASIESFMDEENKLKCDRATSQIHCNVEKQRRLVDKIARQLLEFRTANKVDNLRSQREATELSLKSVTADVLSREKQEAQLVEWEKLLRAVQKDPMVYAKLAANVSHAKEISGEFSVYQTANIDHQKLLDAFTENHPEVVAKRRDVDRARQVFLDAAGRAQLTCRSELQVTRNQLTNLRLKQEKHRNDLSSTSQRIILAESGISQLEAEYGAASRLLERLILDENKARTDAEYNNERVHAGRHAIVPQRAVSPNPTVIFVIGSVGSLLLGLAFTCVIGRVKRRRMPKMLKGESLWNEKMQRI